MANNTKEMAERLRLSRERLLASDLKQNTRAWRLWAACVEATVGYTREADQTYVVGLARRAGMERQVASQLLQRFSELGVFAWASGPRGSHAPGMLALPSGGQSDTMSHAAQGVKVTPLHSGELSVESMSNAVSIDTGTHHSPLIDAPDSVEGSEEWRAERHAGPEALPEPAWDPVELAAALEESLAGDEPDPYADLSPALRRCFGLDNPDGWHGDERTGDGIGDDERSQMRWRADNPRKVRSRRNAER
jgi:hypothetical protein